MPCAPSVLSYQTMHITNELIHNPGVNQKLDELKVNFVPGKLSSPVKRQSVADSVRVSNVPLYQHRGGDGCLQAVHTLNTMLSTCLRRKRRSWSLANDRHSYCTLSAPNIIGEQQLLCDFDC